MSANPSLLQINTRVSLSERGAALGRAATLDDFTDPSLDRIAADGFEWVWLLGVWRTGEAGRSVSLRQREWQHEYRELIGDYTAEDVAGSPFAISDYEVNGEYGGPAALARLRARLARRGLKLMLDFVPNHTALDHPWATEHAEFYIHGTETDLAAEPENYLRIGAHVLAHGRDPYFPGWPDTLQLNYRHRGLREAMAGVLESIAGQCDGVRCDMAMLVLPETIGRTWGHRSAPADGSAPVDEPFWPFAIGAVKSEHPGFTFMAEAYWDLEWTLQQQGFDYTYDKRLYDRLRAGDAAPVAGHLHADALYQHRSVRFLENHDEPRAAAVFGDSRMHEAAAVVALLAPGLRFVHEGQATGRRYRASNHLRRRAVEPVDRDLEKFYGRLLGVMQRDEVRDGEWQLLEARPARDGSASHRQFVAFAWKKGDRLVVAAVNFAPQRGECLLPLPLAAQSGAVRLSDRLDPTVAYERDASAVSGEGLYLEVPPWRRHVFDVEVAK